MATTTQHMWVNDFKKYLIRNEIDDHLPEIVISYIDGMLDDYRKVISSKHGQIKVLEAEKKRLLDVINDLSTERAEAIIRYEQLEKRSTVPI